MATPQEILDRLRTATGEEFTRLRQQFMAGVQAGDPAFVRAGGAVGRRLPSGQVELQIAPGGQLQTTTFTPGTGQVPNALAALGAQAPPGGTTTAGALTAAGAAPATAFAPLGQQGAQPQGLALLDALLQRLPPPPAPQPTGGQELLQAFRSELERRRQEGITGIQERTAQEQERLKAFLADIGALRGGFTGKELERLTTESLREQRALESELGLQFAQLMNQVQVQQWQQQFQTFQARQSQVAQALQVAGFLSDEEARRFEREQNQRTQTVDEIFRVINQTGEVTPAQAAALAEFGITIEPGKTLAGRAAEFQQTIREPERTPQQQVLDAIFMKLQRGEALTPDERALVGLSAETPGETTQLTRADLSARFRFMKLAGTVTTITEAKAFLAEAVAQGTVPVQLALSFLPELEALFAQRPKGRRDQPSAPRIGPLSPQEKEEFRAVAP